MAAHPPIWVQLEVTSVVDLQAALLEYAPEALVRIGVTVTDLSESPKLHQLLRRALLNPGWEPRFGTVDMLKRAEDHYANLEVLHMACGIIRDDMVDGKPLPKNLFAWLTQLANEVVTSADISRSVPVLGSITIEAQMIGRVLRAFGFGSPDVEAHIMTDDEIAWFQVEGVLALGQSQMERGLIQDRMLLKLKNLQETIKSWQILSYIA